MLSKQLLSLPKPTFSSTVRNGCRAFASSSDEPRTSWSERLVEGSMNRRALYGKYPYNSAYHRFVYHRTYKGPVQAVILDWAGTVMDYGVQAPAAAFSEAFAQAGCPISIAEARVPMGTRKMTHIRRITELESVRARWKQAFGRYPNKEDIKKIYDIYIPLQVEAIKKHTDMIPGAVETSKLLQERGIKIGTTTGYTRDLMDVIEEAAFKAGYKPDSTITASEVPEGRPEPWMCLRNAERLRVFPLESMVKVGDTLSDIEEGLNAGMWAIGLAKTGNELGMTKQQVDALPKEELDLKLSRAYTSLYQAGAHYVVDDITQVPAILDVICERLAQGEKPYTP